MTRRFHLKANPEPERMSVRLTDIEICAPREDGQHEYTAIAQFWDIVNDRLMVFRKGSFAKTIAEQLGRDVTPATSRIKINDSHMHTARSTLGSVVEADEREIGVWHRGLLSATELEIFTKMREGHVDEESIEFFSVLESTTRVPLADVPVGAFIWEEAKGDGMVEVREMLEVAWVGLAILPASSQARRALLEFNCAVPFQDLPVAEASTPWDVEGAAERLATWAGKIDQLGGRQRGSFPNYAKLARAHLLRGPIKGGQETFLGQIADVVDGQLVVVPEALEIALVDLADVTQLGGPNSIACATTVGRYREKLRHYPAPTQKSVADPERCTCGDGTRRPCPLGLSAHAVGAPLDASAKGQLPSNADSAEDPAGPAPVTSGSPPTDETASDAAVALPHDADARLKLLSLRLSVVAATHPEVSDSGIPTKPGRRLPRSGSAAV